MDGGAHADRRPVLRQHLSWMTAYVRANRRMGPIERLLEWMTVPTVETAAHRCVDCGAVAEAGETECAGCGGEVEQVVREPVELYWPHY